MPTAILNITYITEGLPGQHALVNAGFDSLESASCDVIDHDLSGGSPYSLVDADWRGGIAHRFTSAVGATIVNIPQIKGTKRIINNSGQQVTIQRGSGTVVFADGTDGWVTADGTTNGVE